MDLIRTCKDNGTTILTGLGLVGVASTAILTAKATPKALDILEEKEQYKKEHYGKSLTRFEKFLAVIPPYLPAILMGTATGACILGVNQMHKNKEAALMSAYAVLNNSYKEYQHKVKEIFGEAGEKKVREEIEKDKFLHEKYGSVDEKKLFYDEFSNRYFEMSLFELQVAVYDVNRIYNHIGELTLNEFYEFINLKPTDLGDKIGWNAAKDWECNNFSWIHVYLQEIETPDNLEVLAIKFNIDPSDDFQDW